jgi:hypothetical protein
MPVSNVSTDSACLRTKSWWEYFDTNVEKYARVKKIARRELCKLYLNNITKWRWIRWARCVTLMGNVWNAFKIFSFGSPKGKVYLEILVQMSRQYDKTGVHWSSEGSFTRRGRWRQQGIQANNKCNSDTRGHCKNTVIQGNCCDNVMKDETGVKTWTGW